MDIFSRFKKHYTHYFIGVIVPAIINGVSVPLLKQFLGTEKYGQYALYFNLMLIVNLLMCGWLWQGILRFNAREEDKKAFAGKIFFIAWLFPTVLFIPILLAVWYVSSSFLLGAMFAFTLLAAALQLAVQAVLQANFLSKITVLGEAVRTISWLALILLCIYFQQTYTWFLFTALFLSYTCSTLFLYFKSSHIQPRDRFLFPGGWKIEIKNLLKYGIPLSLWYVFFYLVTYIDKVYMLRLYGPLVQGNYNALFDFTSKGLVLLLAPILVSAYPLLSEAYEKGQHATIKQMIIKLVGYEVLAMIIATSGYKFIGYKLLFLLLKIPESALYINMGLLIIGGTFIWQISLLIQKTLELRFKSMALLISVIVAFMGQWLFYIVYPQSTPLLLPIGYLLSSLMYLLSVLILQTKKLRTTL